MGFKTITLTEEAYKVLSMEKKKDESFSEVIKTHQRTGKTKRLTRRLENDRCRSSRDLLQPQAELEEINLETARQDPRLLKCLETHLLVGVLRKHERATRKVEEGLREARELLERLAKI